MKKQSFFFSVIAALALVIFSFSGCDTTLSEGNPDAAEVSRSIGSVQDDLTGTKWLGNIGSDYGVTLIEFTSSTTATGTLGNTVHRFEYNLVDPANGDYSLTESGQPYSWTITITGNILTFANNSFKPYSADPGQFKSISYITVPVDLTSLAGTHWLGVGPRGESLLDNIVSTSGTTTYDLEGTFGPDTTGDFEITGYTYTGGTGSGSMSRGAGPFTSDGRAATLTFPNFWGHEVPVVFQGFVYN